jgi:AraC-like DNA-binding protein
VDFGLLNGARDTLFRPAHEPHYELIEEQVEELKVLVSSVEQELDNNEDLLAATFLGILLGKCSTWMKSDPKIPADKGDGDVVTRFQRMVEAHYTTRTKVSEYVDDLYVSAGHLNELTKARTGMSCGQLILQRRILEAKRLLLHSNLAVKEIAYALGMDDPAYFNRVFRKSVGVPPATFRNTIREKYN